MVECCLQSVEYVPPCLDERKVGFLAPKDRLLLVECVCSHWFLVYVLGKGLQINSYLLKYGHERLKMGLGKDRAVSAGWNAST